MIILLCSSGVSEFLLLIILAMCQMLFLVNSMVLMALPSADCIYKGSNNWPMNKCRHARKLKYQSRFLNVFAMVLDSWLLSILNILPILRHFCFRLLNLLRNGVFYFIATSAIIASIQLFSVRFIRCIRSSGNRLRCWKL